MQEITEPTGLREAKKAATRRALTMAARRLVVRDGFDAVTVEQIAAAGGVSPRTFFNYFDTKESAVLGSDGPAENLAAQETFAAGGPTGDVLTDMLSLFDLERALQEEGLESLQLSLRIAQQEPRIIAANLGRIAAFETKVAGLLARRAGLDAPDRRCTNQAALGLGLAFRALVNAITEGSTDVARELAALRADGATLLA
jgi:AcrR family transcriptional regulator